METTRALFFFFLQKLHVPRQRAKPGHRATWPSSFPNKVTTTAREVGPPRAKPRPMSRRQRSAPKANISPSVRLGLTSIVAGNEAGIRTMLSAAASDDLVEKLAEPHVERGL